MAQKKQKRKQKKQNKNNTKTIQQQNKNKAKAKKPKHKRKTKTRNTKTPKPSKPKKTKISHPTKAPKLEKKQEFLTLLQLPDTQKQTETHLFAMFQKQPTIFHRFSVFFNIQLFYCNRCALLKYTIRIVFSEEHSFSETQLVKPTFSPMSKKTPFSTKKRCHF